jgi:hypothetical protein
VQARSQQQWYRANIPLAPCHIILLLLLLLLLSIVCISVPQQPYYFGWMNHLRSGLYAMTAYIALMLTVNCWFEQVLQGKDWLTEDQKAAERLPRARLISDLALELLPAALGIGVLASWLRLKIAMNRALHKFRCATYSSGLLHSARNACAGGLMCILGGSAS